MGNARSLLGSLAVAGILVLAYASAYLLRQTLLSLRHGIDESGILVTALVSAYVVSSLAQALRRSGGKAWIVQRVLAVALYLGVVAMGAAGVRLMGTEGDAGWVYGGGLVAVALVIGVAALPVELYLAKATRRDRTSTGTNPSSPASRSRPERTG